jgi:hypothetical protein
MKIYLAATAPGNEIQRERDARYPNPIVKLLSHHKQNNDQ